MLLLDKSLNRPSINEGRGTGKIMKNTYITMAYDDFVYVLQVLCTSCQMLLHQWCNTKLFIRLLWCSDMEWVCQCK